MPGQRPTQVIVRNLDPSVVERLKRRARANGRSLEAELRIVLDQYARWGTVSEASPPYLLEPGTKLQPPRVKWPKDAVRFEPFQAFRASGKPASDIVIEDRG